VLTKVAESLHFGDGGMFLIALALCMGFRVHFVFPSMDTIFVVI
jgi:hypothetical protein